MADDNKPEALIPYTTAAMLAQRIFAHQLLFELVDVGVLPQGRAARVADTVASALRNQVSFTANPQPFEHFAKSYEGMAADLLGMDPIPPDK